MPVFPVLERFAGRKLRDFLRALSEVAESDRIVPGPGLVVSASRGGRVLSVQGGPGGTALVKVRSTGTITVASGTAPNVTPGTGSGVRVDYTGSGTFADITGAITLKNPSRCSIASGRYGWAAWITGTTYLIVSMDM